MKTRIFCSLWMAVTALLMGGCTTENNKPAPSDNIPITFTIATPGSEGVIYPNQRATRATHDQAEWAIKQMSLLVYDATEEATPKFLRKHDLATDISLYDNGNGTYTFSIEAPISDLNAKRKFVFVVNDDAAVAETAVGSTEETLHTATTASIALNDNDTADKLADTDNGIAMSGTATTDGVNEVITITPGLKCQVKLTRIVARIDIQNNTPNMTLESAVLVKAAKQGYIFKQEAISAPTEERIILGSNANVDITAQHPVLGPDDTFTPKTFNKVFYTYERPNTTEDYAAVRISYRVNDSKGTIEVPFIRTEVGGTQTPVDITRNSLYTIVLGNGEPVETNPLTFSIKVEDWNVVEMPEEIGPGIDELDPESQAALNAALKVNMFTEFNAKAFDLESKTISEFYNTMTVSASDCPISSYASWVDLQAAGAVANDAIFTGPAGQGKYRLPTSGELGLLLPIFTEEDQRLNGTGMYYCYWNDNESTNTQNFYAVPTPFIETLYLKNGADNMPDQTHPDDPDYTISGISQLKVGPQTEQVTYIDADQPYYYNIHLVYGLRFKGTDQYAAYRWETCQIDGKPLERYLSIKIKALVPSDMTTTIDDVSDETFWQDGFIEFKFPATGSTNKGSIINRGFHGCCWTSSLHEADTDAYGLGFALFDANVYPLNILSATFQLRFVKVE